MTTTTQGLNQTVLTISQDEDTEDLVITAPGGTVTPIRIHYGPAPTWPSPKELEDAVIEAVRAVFRQANGTDDPALWVGTDA